MAFSRGIPEILLLRFLDEPKSCCDASTGNRLTIFAEHRGVFYQLALDEDGRVWSIGLGDRSAFVNSSLGKFARFAYAVIEPNKNFDDAENRGDIAEFQRQVVLLRNRMQEIDPAFLEHEHSWWAGYLAGI
jgi:alpha-tubulin suppressor-like RCC1 family protein